jgi:hypothetical protein
MRAVNSTQFTEILKTSAQIIDEYRQSHGINTLADPARVLVIGSQSILGSINSDYAPAQATLSIELDIAVLPTYEDELSFDNPAEEFADAIDAFIGEDSIFQQNHNVYAQGVESKAAILPDGWESRLVEVRSEVIPAGVRVMCLDRYDLCCAKLCRSEPKDTVYVSSLVAAGDINPMKLELRFKRITDNRLSPPMRSIALGTVRSLFPNSSC